MRISLPASLEQHIVLATAQFQAKWPDVSFGLTSTDRNVDLVAEGFDVAIRSGQLKDSTLRVRKLTEVPRALCASPKYLETAPPLNHPRDIENHNCLALRRNPGEKTWQFKSDNEIFDVAVQGEFTANSGNMLVTAARHGRGLLLFPKWITGPAIAKGELVNLLPSYSPYPATSTLYAVHPYQRFVPPKVKVFIDFLRKRFNEEYDWSVNPAGKHFHVIEVNINPSYGP